MTAFNYEPSKLGTPPGSLDLTFCAWKCAARRSALDQKAVPKKSRNNEQQQSLRILCNDSGIRIIYIIYICPIYIYTHYVLYIYSIVHTHHHGIVFSQQTFSTAAIWKSSRTCKVLPSPISSPNNTRPPRWSPKAKLSWTLNLDIQKTSKKRLHLKKWRYFWECLKIYPNSVVPLKMYSDLLEQPKNGLLTLPLPKARWDETSHR